MMSAEKKNLIYAAIVSFVGGLLYGYAIGFVPIFTTFNDYNTNCTVKMSEAACSNRLPPAACVWVQEAEVLRPPESPEDKRLSLPSAVDESESSNGWDQQQLKGGQCLFSDYLTVNCTLQFKDKESCINNQEGHGICHWDATGGICVHKPDWTPTQTGLYASAMIIGGMFGSLGVGPLVDRIGRRKALGLIGVVAIIASIMASVSQANGSYALLIVARHVIGLSAGAACVVCPMYAEEMGPEEYKNPLVVIFQMGCTGGILLAALLGLILEPRDFYQDLEMNMRFSVLNAVQWITSVVCLPVAWMIPESTVWLRRMGKEGQGLVGEDEDEVSDRTALNSRQEQEQHTTASGGMSVKTSGLTDEEEGPGGKSPQNHGTKKKEVVYKVIPVWLIVIISLVLSASQQLTGINAVMNYAPTIAQAAGVKALLGNFIIMLWNFLTSIVAFPFAKRFAARKLYLVGTVVASLACLVNGLPVYPGWLDGVMSETGRHIMAGIGIMVFIAAFEVAMGPVFYMLAVEMFPTKYRAVGCAYTNMTQFLMNIIINFGFPVTVVALSGGESGNQNKGMGLMFIIFGAIGLCSVPPMWKWLYPAPHDEEEEEGADVVAQAS